jgi:hypothetical protein
VHLRSLVYTPTGGVCRGAAGGRERVRVGCGDGEVQRGRTSCGGANNMGLDVGRTNH